MVYKKGATVINFYEESVIAQSESEFVSGHKHLMDEKELKEVYALIVKKNKPKKAVEKQVPPSLN